MKTKPKNTILSKLMLWGSAITTFFFMPKTAWGTACNSENLNPDEKLECLFPTEQDLIEGSPQGEQTGTSLPHGDIIGDFLPFFINTALAVAGTLIFISLLYTGYIFVFANDNEENIEKGKKILIYTAIGAFVMAISYAVIFGIAKLDLD